MNFPLPYLITFRYRLSLYKWFCSWANICRSLDHVITYQSTCLFFRLSKVRAQTKKYAAYLFTFSFLFFLMMFASAAYALPFCQICGQTRRAHRWYGVVRYAVKRWPERGGSVPRCLCVFVVCIQRWTGRGRGIQLFQQRKFNVARAFNYSSRPPREICGAQRRRPTKSDCVLDRDRAH